MTNKKRGGIKDPNILKKVILEFTSDEVDVMIKPVIDKLNTEGKAIIGGLCSLELKESKRTQRFDFKTQQWVKVPKKKRLSIKLNPLFSKKILSQVK